MKKLLVYWPYFQHYHLARLLSLKKSCDASGIQLVALALSRQSSDLHKSVDCPDIAELVYLDSIGNLAESTDVRLVKFIREIKPDCALINGYAESASRIILIEALRHRIGAVLMSDSKQDDSPRSFLKERFKQALVSSFGGAVVASRHASAYLKVLGLPQEYHYKPYDVVDNVYWAKPAPKVSGEYILSIGRFIPKKNFVKLIQAYAQVLKRSSHPLPSLRLIGAGPEEALLKNLVQSLALSNNVSIEPYREPDELRQIYQGARLFVLASDHEEQWGLVVNEAMAAGVPVIASEKIGAVPDLLENRVTGLTFDPYLVSSIAAALEQALKEPEQMQTLRVQAHARLRKQFSCEKFAEAAIEAAKTASSRQSAIKSSWIDALILKLFALLAKRTSI